MTDRIRTLTIRLDRDIRTDDVEPLVAAIRQLRGVAEVAHGPVTHPNEWAIRAAALSEIEMEFVDMLRKRRV
jgi:hypothetical protein